MSAEDAEAKSKLLCTTYWTAKEVASLLRVSDASVYRMAEEDVSMPCLIIGRGALKPDSLGRRARGQIRFPVERLLSWLRSKEQGFGRPRRSRELTLPSPQPPGSVEPTSPNGRQRAQARAQKRAAGTNPCLPGASP